MAVVSRNGSCKSCGKKYLFRVGVGVEKNCIHTIDCLECTLPISINVLSIEGGARIQAEENCTLSDGIDDPEAVVMNLHPCFAIELTQLHSRYYFASHDYIFKIEPYMRKVPGTLQDMATQFELPNCKNIWPVIRNIIELDASGANTKALNAQIQQYQLMRKKYDPSFIATTTESAVASFFDDMFYPKINKLLTPSLQQLAELKISHSDELKRFIEFYRDNLLQENRQRYISIFSDYFRNYEQFRQILIHARIDDSDVDNRVVASKQFEAVKLFYGQSFETITTHYTTLACLNNIREGRKFDEFKSMNLNKFRKDVDKSKRSNPFKDNQILALFTECENSPLRNGSHHASI